MSAPTLTLAISGCLLLAACARQPATRPTPAAAGSRPPSASSNAVSRRPSSVVAAEGAGNDGASLPKTTGIPACDDYLSSYVACHRSAGIFTPGQLPARYEAMRTSLLRDSQNPDIRPQLAQRCNSLASQLREALHGKACAVNPAPTDSSR